MSLEALSHVASAAFPIFEQEKIDAKIEYDGRDQGLNMRISPLPSVIPPSIPLLSRHSSYSVPSFNLPAKAIDWSRLITLEERRYIREKIKSAYQSKASSYEELLELSCAIEEEFVFASAPSRLDYFKSGVQYEKRVAEKDNQMRSCLSGSLKHPISSSSAAEDNAEASEVPLKRIKTEKTAI